MNSEYIIDVAVIVDGSNIYRKIMNLMNSKILENLTCGLLIPL